ncbi:Gfo/Idh/MocA family protein [Paenibacillus soyae]|uniref:Gfo/Idh/MocA family oxidoreductase n=1 Tax=Paenibacillus soyae TaxID=2969249 RepID=A0A9X2MW32_9BACL|nr:Gfo/Idh/MocA family oxidoreductase [Paenibacillus soyae]MCR2804747.1 Gfo/Idh/MocA family oxidoreductase [Paenibacillus soyae]
MYRGITIGTGHFAGIQLEAWSQVQGAEIVGLAGRNAVTTGALAEQFGIKRHGQDVIALIEELQPHFIDICTPPDSHLHYAQIAADRGIPVLCQKPVAPTQEESKRLVKYCKERGVPIMINENWRWQGWYREVKRILESGLLGKLFHVYFAMRPGDGYGPQPYPLQPYFKDMERFLLFETGVHWIDTYRMLFGEISSVFCDVRTWNPVCKGEDAAIVYFSFQSGMTGLYDANRVVYMEEVRSPAYGWMTLEGENGKLRLSQDGSIYVTLRGGQEYKHDYELPLGWKGGCAVATQQHFIDVLGQGGVFETDGDDYLISQEIVYACYESAQLKKMVGKWSIIEEAIEKAE